MAVNGLELITPTSIVVTGSGSSATINAGGSVTFTTAATLSLNGVFTSAYDNYMVVVQCLATVAAAIRIRWRLAGTDATGSNYVQQSLQSNGTAVTGSRSTNNFSDFGSISTNRQGQTVYVYGPALAQPTVLRGVDAGAQSAAFIYDVASTHSLSTAYDGFTVFPNGGTLTGLIKVYGLAQ